MTERQQKIALSMIPGITAEVIRSMDAAGVTAADFFSLDSPELSRVLDMRHVFPRAQRDEALARAGREEEFCTRHSIKVSFLTDDDYPHRLSQCYDAPVALYILGNCNLDAAQALAVVGTRRPTGYGLDFCARVVEELAGCFPDDLLIVSGLAYGIDASAHLAALKHKVPTAAVVAHGLDIIYPAQHRQLAAEIIRAGGAIISEYPKGVKPFRGNFLARNRIVAGMSDATLVAESPVKGGAMSTANMAFEYDRDVFALPGRATDAASAGCNKLIKRNKAHLCTDASDIVVAMGWRPMNLGVIVEQPGLFPDMDDDMRPIHDLLQRHGMPLTPDEIHEALGTPMARLLSLLSEMEFDGIVTKSPGNRYSL